MVCSIIKSGHIFQSYATIGLDFSGNKVGVIEKLETRGNI